MKEFYVKGSIAPSRPRVMAVCPRGHAVSVGRGTHRLGYELRNQPLWGADLVDLRGRQHNRRRYRESSIGPTESKTLSMRGSFMRENREISSSLAGNGSASRVGKAKAVTP